ncbi:hypothetical protein chiPu_0007415 [Chiloscyllium punctatum]|uniref:Uncharacterized protein n=1 Tax=Chiloscyllium punctatum TaxID=137246 RepID=A0A401SF60_CHIPU|nr:hypothetical protein [Chiloscyllium punctatum]
MNRRSDLSFSEAVAVSLNEIRARSYTTFRIRTGTSFFHSEVHAILSIVQPLLLDIVCLLIYCVLVSLKSNTCKHPCSLTSEGNRARF